MSLLSDLIAQLRALIDRNSETMSAARGARDTIEATMAPLQTALDDSSNPTAHEGLAQLQAALEKLDEAQVLLQAGNSAMDSYITGPLLGGGAGSGSSEAASFGGVAPPRPTDQIREKKRKPGHFARVRVIDGNGTPLYDYQIESGNQTGQEKALGRRKGASASHTENRSVRMHGSAHPEINDDPFFNTHPIPPGSHVEISGTRPPCPQCKNAMKRLVRDRQADVVYKWGEDETWP